MRRLRAVSAVLVPLVLLGACGGELGADVGPGPSSSAGASDEAGDPPEDVDVCALLPAAAASELVGSTVDAEDGPLDTCEYGQEDPEATSFSLAVQPESEVGGAQGYLDGLTTAVTVEKESVPDVGERARIVTGEVAGFHQVAGAALADGIVYSVYLSPGDDLDAAAELALVEELLRAVVDAV